MTKLDEPTKKELALALGAAMGELDGNPEALDNFRRNLVKLVDIERIIPLLAYQQQCIEGVLCENRDVATESADA